MKSLLMLITPIGVAVGLAAALLVGSPTRASAANECTKACECLDTCETKFLACQEKNCTGKEGRAQGKCTIACNFKLLKCSKKCGGDACDCGGY